MICVPSQATEVEKRAVIDAARNTGAKKVHLMRALQQQLERD